MRRTPLFPAHQEIGGKLIEFGGWEMPVHYTSITDEHLAVRNAAGLFDISHMGELRVAGPAAEAFLNHALTNDVRKILPGQGQYTLLCNENGGVVDDLYVYRLAPEEYLLIVNASRTAADVAWFQKLQTNFPNQSGLVFEDQSDRWGAVAVQGPAVIRFIDRCFPGASSAGTAVAHPSELKKNQVARFAFQGAGVWVARTGYTGEDGFEVIAPADRILGVWKSLLAEGAGEGLKPAGLGARDTLRTEVCYPLYGHELDENTTPIEAGVGFFVALDKADFVGKAALARQKAGGTTKKLIAFRMTGKVAPPRPHYTIHAPGDNTPVIGQVVSGTQSPSLCCGIGMGYVPPEFARAGQELDIEIRGRRARAQVVPKPIYRKPN
jgi:aminomethyltransferase